MSLSCGIRSGQAPAKIYPPLLLFLNGRSKNCYSLWHTHASIISPLVPFIPGYRRGVLPVTAPLERLPCWKLGLVKDLGKVISARQERHRTLLMSLCHRSRLAWQKHGLVTPVTLIQNWGSRVWSLSVPPLALESSSSADKRKFLRLSPGKTFFGGCGRKCKSLKGFATEYYKTETYYRTRTIAKISNTIKKGRNRHIYIFTWYSAKLTAVFRVMIDISQEKIVSDY